MDNSEINVVSADIFRELAEELNKESARGAILLGAAWIDDQLSLLLKATLVAPISPKEDSLLDRAMPLGDFGPKIELAYRLGLIRRESYQSLRIIRSLRNDFAHFKQPISLETQSVADRVRNLYGLNQELLHSVDEIINTIAAGHRNLVIDPDAYSLPNNHRFNFLVALVAAGLAYAVAQAKRIQELV